jgi:hypothetical protein
MHLVRQNPSPHPIAAASPTVATPRWNGARNYLDFRGVLGAGSEGPRAALAHSRGELSRRTSFVGETKHSLEERSGEPAHGKYNDMEHVGVINQISNCRRVDEHIANADNKQKNRLDYRYRD